MASMRMFERREFSNWLKQWLADATEKNFEFATVPEDTSTPYGILYQLPSPKPYGDYEEPERDLTLVYQVSSVGRGTEDAQWLADRVRHAMVGRPYRPMTAPVRGGSPLWTVQWRESDGLGGIVPSGDYLFKVDDMFRVKVSSANAEA